MKKILTKKGFTLIELIVVIAILAILAAILIPSLTNYINKANRAKDQANARSFYTAVALDVATDLTSWPAATYTAIPAAAVLEATNPCAGGLSITVATGGGAISAFTCTINSVVYSAPDFVGTP